MKRKSPLFVDRIQFLIDDGTLSENPTAIRGHLFDFRSDFLAERPVAGVAVMLELSNMRRERDVRRQVALSLVDLSLRRVVAKKVVDVDLMRNESFRVHYIYFPLDRADLKTPHRYKLMVTDLSASRTIAERTFRLWPQSRLPHPSQWYAVTGAGLRPAEENVMYKNIRTIDEDDYYVKFNVLHKLDSLHHDALPELELRLYHPDGDSFAMHFAKPAPAGKGSVDDGQSQLEQRFFTYDECNGVFYAELRCMDYPVAGFTFDTEADDSRGVWSGPDLGSLEKYSPEAAVARSRQIEPTSRKPIRQPIITR